MREILFRGKHVFDGKWGYGGYAESKSGRVCLAGISKLGMVDGYEVDPETVGQFTGLTDKNGVKIFEGDIVSADIERPYLIVEFRDGCFMFNCNDGGEDYYDIMLPILNEPQTQYKYGEVVGNIFDNPELMESGANND